MRRLRADYQDDYNGDGADQDSYQGESEDQSQDQNSDQGTSQDQPQDQTDAAPQLTQDELDAAAQQVDSERGGSGDLPTPAQDAGGKICHVYCFHASGVIGMDDYNPSVTYCSASEHEDKDFAERIAQYLRRRYPNVTYSVCG